MFSIRDRSYNKKQQSKGHFPLERAPHPSNGLEWRVPRWAKEHPVYKEHLLYKELQEVASLILNRGPSILDFLGMT